MKFKKKTISYVDIDVRIVGATLLSVEEYVTARAYIPLIDAWWWLRSPGSISYCVACVRRDGDVCELGSGVEDDDVAVRPALLLQSENLFIADEFIFGGKEWVYIGNGLAVAKKALLCKMPFREDFKAKDANNYEVSDVKKYLEKWLREVMAHEAD